MNTAATNLEEPDAAQGAPKFFVMYADFATGLRGRRFAETLAEELGNSANPDITLWRSELLDVPALAELASHDARRSDVMILSLPADAGISPASRRWIGAWAQSAGAGAGLVALFGPGNSRPLDATRCYLREIANEAGVDFFCHCAHPPRRTRHASDFGPPQGSATHSASTHAPAGLRTMAA